jgi:predicted transcriptional regulator
MQDEGRNALHGSLANVKDRSIDPSFIAGYRVDFSPMEKNILLIAKQLMKKHYLLDTRDLKIQATKELKDITSEAIEAAIRTLTAKKILFDGASMTKDDVLVNDTRRRVFEFICHRPGIHFSAIRSAVSTDSRSLLFHLDVLKRFGFVRFELFHKSKAYFELSSPKELDMVHYYTQNGNARWILKAILENQPISLNDLAAILKDVMSSQVLAHRVKILMEHKLVSGKSEVNKLISLSIPPRYKNLIRTELSSLESTEIIFA